MAATLPSLLTNLPVEGTFVQPQLNRYHHPFRSPFDSERLNLEVNQLRYDFYRLRNRFDTIVASLDNYNEGVVNGYLSAVAFSSFAEINIRLAQITKRLEMLENS